MSTIDMRNDVTTWLDELDDNFLAAVHAMVGTYVNKQQSSVLGYDADGNTLLAEDMKKIYAAEVEGVKQGKYLTIEDFEKESVKW